MRISDGSSDVCSSDLTYVQLFSSICVTSAPARHQEFSAVERCTGRASLRVDYEGQVLTLGACIVLKDRLHEKVRFPPLPSGVGRVRDSGNTCPHQLAKGRIIRTHGGVHGWTDGGPPFTGPTASPFIAFFDPGKDHAGHDH